jgi:hypothetical protein
MCRSQWPCGLRCRSSAARLLRSWVRNPWGTWMFVCCECCVLSGRGLCDGLITRPEESYRLWRVVGCDQETSINEEAKARYRAVENTTTMGCNARKTKQTNKQTTNCKCNKEFLRKDRNRIATTAFRITISCLRLVYCCYTTEASYFM